MRCAAIALQSSAAQGGFERLQAAQSLVARDHQQLAKSLERNYFSLENGGGGIRTPERPQRPLTVFKTVAFVRSATPPAVLQVIVAARPAGHATSTRLRRDLGGCAERLEHLGNLDPAVDVLEVLQDRDECPPNGDGGPVQRVNRLR
jgi:hypothetical protein